ncbi:hypothetical protein MZK49_27575 [Ensifer sesbaniae]|uniref:hypothetical protein n=1 Tax=Ensifer sesbaniae TaxID=1214071 RepID=UPI002001B92A|nr:hypothetical protein [Ensifer sesbaniae]
MADLFGNSQTEAATKWCPTVWLDEVAGILVTDPADCVQQRRLDFARRRRRE